MKLCPSGRVYSPMRILVVEDQLKILDFIQQGLKESGFTVDPCTSGEEGLEKAVAGSYDGMVLDVMLPGRDGLSVLRELRERGIPVPVILLTARGGLNERVEGLDSGADDYLTKPFYVEELVARLRALIRRGGEAPASVLSVADLSVNLLTREVRRGGEAIELSPREFSLLIYLMRSPGRTYARSQISEHVWNTHFDTGTNMVDVAVARLRKKIDGAADVKLLETVRGVGYRITAVESQS